MIYELRTNRFVAGTDDSDCLLRIGGGVNTNYATTNSRKNTTEAFMIQNVDGTMTERNNNLYNRNCNHSHQHLYQTT